MINVLRVFSRISAAATVKLTPASSQLAAQLQLALPHCRAQYIPLSFHKFFVVVGEELLSCRVKSAAMAVAQRVETEK